MFPNTINIGKMARIYLGIEESVPVKVGRNNKNQAKNWYRISSFFIFFKRIKITKNTDKNSKTAIKYSKEKSAKKKIFKYR